MKKLFTAVVGCLLFSFPLTAQVNPLPIQAQDAGPRQGHSSLAPLPHKKSALKRSMQVLIFPHTLSNDRRHGTPDDPRRVSFFTKKTPLKLELKNGKIFRSKGFHLDLSESGKMAIRNLEGSLLARARDIRLSGENPTRVHRPSNPDLSHRYEGRFRAVVRGDKILVINKVSMENYIRGVVPSEIIPSWPLEAQKAQAVAARTYARYHQLTANRESPYDVDDTARFQVYTGLDHVTNRTDRAVKETAHEIMLYGQRVPVAYFHSYSGGRTDSAENIFDQSDAPYCLPKAELFSRDELRRELSPGARWIVNWSTDPYSSKELLSKWKKSEITENRFSEFEKGAPLLLQETARQPKFDSLKTLKVLQPTTREITSLKFNEVRSSIGWAEFPSYHFSLEKKGENSWVFSGHGWGHHVGMSQWGAFMMAKNLGKEYREILHHYYSDIRISHL